MDQLLGRLPARLVELGTLPRAAKLGIVVILAGLLVDAAVHALGAGTTGSVDALVARQHLAHLLVLVGMVITLGGVVVDGARVSGRHGRPGRRSSHAVR